MPASGKNGPRRRCEGSQVYKYRPNDEPLILPGEVAWQGQGIFSQWAPEDGNLGIAVVQTDKAFLKEFGRRLSERGIEVTLKTSKGSVTVRGQLRDSVIEDWLKTYIQTAREIALARRGKEGSGGEPHSESKDA